MGYIDVGKLADCGRSAPSELRFRDVDLAAARELGAACDIGPTVAQVMLHRGVRDEEQARDFLDPKLSGLTPPDGMADREAAALRLADAVKRGERIVVFGDYDVDGTTSATVVADVLERLGGTVRLLIADRFDGGYGFSQPALARALEAGAQLIVTCDCGSSDHERIAEAKRRGVDVVVVDHHLVPSEPLPAYAFLNPHRPDCRFAFKHLCSAGLALVVGASVRAALAMPLDLRAWLDLIAIGTIADVAPLCGDNRRLVRAGLLRVASPSARPGVVALREAARIRAGTPVGGMDVSFRLAPRLNAAGRLGESDVAARLLRATDLTQARQLAARLEQINQERRAIQARITDEAFAQVETVYGERLDGGLVVASEGWHRGVVGIVAARIAERYHAPSVVVALDDGVGHGSARTPEGVSVYDAVAACKDHLLKYGGHRAAAGVSLRKEQLPAFRRGFDDACRSQRVAAPPLCAKPWIDVVMGGGFTLPTASELYGLEPLGERNQEPLFLFDEVSVLGARTVGEGHLKLDLAYGDRRFGAFGWEMGELVDRLGPTASVYGSLRADTWRGGDAIELKLAGVLMA